MTAPALQTYTNGQGTLGADGLNTLNQWCVTYAQIKAFTPNPAVNNLLVFMEGYTAAGDGGQGYFYWNSTTGTDDGGVTTIVPTSSTSGCWSRIPNYAPTYTPQTVSNASNATLTAANVTNGILLFTGGTTPTNTFPSASAIIGALPGKQVGSLTDLLIVSENSGTTTLSAGSGVTFTGNTFTIAATSQRLFKIYIASASAVTIYG